MSKNTVLNLGSGGDAMATVDLAGFPTFGYPVGTDSPPPKLPAVCLYVSQAIGTVPTPVTTANTLPVTVNGALPAGANVIGHVLVDSGSITLTGTNTVATNADSTVAPGAAPSKVLAIAGVYTATVPTPSAGQALALQTDAAGGLRVSLAGLMPSFAVSTGSFVPAAAATDIAIINGSASRTIKVLKVKVRLRTTGTPINPTVTLIKRSTANSGGTSTTLSPLAPLDTNNPNAPTATVLSYTANPTTGTSAGVLDGAFLLEGTATAVSTELVFDYSANPIVLRGTAQGLAVNLNGASIAATAAAVVNFLWTEE